MVKGVIFKKDVLCSFFFLVICVTIYFFVEPNDTASLRICADLYIHGGTIWTGTGEYVEAIAVRGNKIHAAGSMEEVGKYYCTDKSTAIQLKGKMLTPGWIDSHVHAIVGGKDLLSIKLTDITSHEMFAKRIEEYIASKKLKKGEWITGSGWNQEKFGGKEWGKVPDRKLIDEITKDNPVWLCKSDLHQCLANTLALNIANISLHNPPDIEGGVFLKYSDSDEINGILKDNAMNYVESIIPVPSRKEKNAYLSAAMNYFAENGITSVHHVANDIYADFKRDMEIFEDYYFSVIGDYSGKQQIYANPFVRTYIAPTIARANESINYNIPSGIKNSFLRLGAVKGFLDGSLGSYTAKMFDNYLDNPQADGFNNSGIFLIPEQEMYEYVKFADSLNLQVVVHAIGNEANHLLLNIFERVIQENGVRDRRFRIEHAQHINKEDHSRLHELGVIASVQPYHLIDDAIFIERALGPIGLENSYPFASLLKNNATLTFGSDWNVAPASPILAIHAAVTRSYLAPNGKNKQFQKNERISVEDCLHAYTDKAAFAEFSETSKGKIKSGYLADFVILDQVITKIAAENIKDTKVDCTIINGKIVYNSNNIKIIPPFLYE